MAKREIFPEQATLAVEIAREVVKVPVDGGPVGVNLVAECLEFVQR